MTDEDEQDLVAMDTGFSVSNPFDLKIVNNKVSKNKANTHVEIEEEEDNEKIQLLQDINDGDKLTDPDFFPLEKNKFD